MSYRLKINNVSVANPIEGGIKVVDEPVWADGAGRNISTGEMIATLVCWKRQVQITWGKLSKSEAKTILDAIKSGGSFFWIEYNDIDESDYVANNTKGLPNTGGSYAKIKVYTSGIPRTLITLANDSDTSRKRITDVAITFTEK